MEFRKALLKHLGLSTFVVVDLETTGLDPEKDQIIESLLNPINDGLVKSHFVA